MRVVLRHIIQAVAVFAVLLGLLGAPRPSVAADPMAETAIGDPQAPVTVLEFSSLTCPHCAAFHGETMPKIKETYIDTGKVRLVYRDFPLDRLALAAAVVAHCVDPSRHFGFIEMLYRDQVAWTQSADPLKELKIRGSARRIIRKRLQRLPGEQASDPGDPAAGPGGAEGVRDQFHPVLHHRRQEAHRRAELREPSARRSTPL